RGPETLRLRRGQHQGAGPLRDDVHRSRPEDSGNPLLQGLERHPARDRLDLRPPIVSRLARPFWRLAALLLLFLVSLPVLASAQAPSPAELARGKYVFGATGGCGCHTVPKQPVNAGGRKYDGPYGTVYSTNITPDRETGIGGWTDEQLITAIRLGRRPNGERLVPVHPYTVFNGMAEEDVKALVVFLRTVPAVKRANLAKKLSVPMFESVFLPTWLAAFAPRETPPTAVPTSGTARGEYLVRAVAHC